MNQQKSDNSYFLIDAGHPRGVFTPPTDPRELGTWNAWLKGALAAIAVIAAASLFWTAGGTVRPLEAIVKMERMAVKLEQTKVIHPDTTRAITLFVDQNGYDCDKVICSTQLQARNRAVRDHLKTLIAEKAPSNELVHVKEQYPLVIDGSVITTGAINGNRIEVNARE
jgi:hypothetical protein